MIKRILPLAVLIGLAFPVYALWEVVLGPNGSLINEGLKETTGKSLDDHIDQAIDSFDECLKYPEICFVAGPMIFPTAVTADQGYQAYDRFLERQVVRWNKIPARLEQHLRPHYPEIDLSKVRYAENIDTKSGNAVAMHYKLYFPGEIQPTLNADDLNWLLHELEHTVQYERRGGKTHLWREYLSKSIGNVVRKMRFDIHDYIDLERAADRKADRLKTEIFSKLVATTSSSTRMIVTALEFHPACGVGSNDPSLTVAEVDLFGVGSSAIATRQPAASSCWTGSCSSADKRGYVGNLDDGYAAPSSINEIWSPDFGGGSDAKEWFSLEYNSAQVMSARIWQWNAACRMASTTPPKQKAFLKRVRVEFDNGMQYEVELPNRWNVVAYF